MKRSTLLVGLMVTVLPAVSLAESVAVPEWHRIARGSDWIVSGTVARHLDNGFVVAVRDILKGSAPSEIVVPEWSPGLKIGTPIAVYGSSSFPRPGFRLPFELMPDWLDQVAVTVRQMSRLEAASSNEEATQLLRELLATGLEEPVFAVTGFVIRNPEAADYRDLWPDLLRAARTARSAWSAKLVLSLLDELAGPEDVGDLISLLDSRDAAFQLRVLDRLRDLTYPLPPIPPKSESLDVPQIRATLTTWYEANKTQLRRRRR